MRGVQPQEVFEFVLDPQQYSRADTKIIWITKLADTPDGMIAREDALFYGVARGSLVTRYRWKAPNRIDITLEHGFLASLHAWFEIVEVDGGTRLTHVEEIEFGRSLLGTVHDWITGGWWSRSVAREVSEIARLLETGERGRSIAGT